MLSRDGAERFKYTKKNHLQPLRLNLLIFPPSLHSCAHLLLLLNGARTCHSHDQSLQPSILSSQRLAFLFQLANPNLQLLYQATNGGSPIPNVPPIPSQFYNNTSGQGPRLGQSQVSGKATNQQGRSSTGPAQNAPSDNFLTSPMDVPTLIATKGYNPVEFDTRPFFVSSAFLNSRVAPT